MEVSVFYSHWKQLWHNYQDMLEAQQISAWFTQGYKTHRRAIQNFVRRLEELDNHLSSCKVKSRAVMLHEEAEQLLHDINNSKQDWDEFISSSKERLKKDNPRFAKTKTEIEEIERDITQTSGRARKTIGSAKTMTKFYSLTEECEAWNNDLKRMIKSIKDKSSSIRTSDEVNDLVNLFGKKVLERLEEQTDRTQKFASIIVEAEERDEENKKGTGEQIRAHPFRKMMKKKQSDILDSVKNLRSEVDNLHSLLEGVKNNVRRPEADSSLPEEPVRKIEPYDLSVLLDENLQASSPQDKDTSAEVHEQPVNDLPPPPDSRTLDMLKVPETREKPKPDYQCSPTPKTDTSSSSMSLSSASEEYFLESNYSDSDIAAGNERVLTARKADAPTITDDDQNTPPSSAKSTSHDRTPSTSSFTTNSRGQTPPPKPARQGRSARQRRRRFWEKELDQYAASWIADRERPKPKAVGSEGASTGSTDESEKVYYRFA